jgi:hypothetical protein
MTKEKYFEMCSSLGNEPIEAEIPVELDDFYIEVQELFEIYRILQDRWDSMNGLYLGKNLENIETLFKLSNIDFTDYKVYLTIISMIDGIRQEQAAKKQKQK